MLYAVITSETGQGAIAEATSAMEALNKTPIVMSLLLHDTAEEQEAPCREIVTGNGIPKGATVDHDDTYALSFFTRCGKCGGSSPPIAIGANVVTIDHPDWSEGIHIYKAHHSETERKL